MSYGEMLREARSRRGLDLGTLSRRLRVRADILAAIESEDFSRLPARGYAKNMVRAYARELGLDERRIGDMFVREFTIYESGGSAPLGRSRAVSDSDSDFREGRTGRVHVQNAPASSRAGSGDRRSASSSQDAASRSGRRTRPTASSRAGRDSAPSASRSAGRSRTAGSGRPAASGSERASASEGRRKQPRTPSPKKGFSLPIPSFNFGSKRSMQTPGLGYVGTQQGPKGGLGASRKSGIAGINPLALILGIIIVVLVIAIVVVLFNSQAKKSEPVPDIPISGLTDTSDTTGEAETTQVSTAPTKAVFKYSVASDGEAWIEIYENGSDTASYAGVVSGPSDKSYDVTGTLEFKTANVTPVTLEVDGTKVEPTADDTGYYVYTVNFPEILAAWQKENLTSSSSSATSSSSSASSSSSSSESSTSSSSSAASNS